MDTISGMTRPAQCAPTGVPTLPVGRSRGCTERLTEPLMQASGGELEGSRTRDLAVAPERSPDVAAVDFHGADFHGVVLERAVAHQALDFVEADLVEEESGVQRLAAVEAPIPVRTRVAEEGVDDGLHGVPQKRSGKLRSDPHL